MGLKKRSKVSAEFSMSSLTDIIFLLLIFFMLTSTVVAPNALNLKLPGSSNPSTSTSTPPEVRISRKGSFYLDGSKMSTSKIESRLRQKARSNGGKQLDVIISPEKGAPVEHVVTIMDMAMRHRINAILATDPQ